MANIVNNDENNIEIARKIRRKAVTMTDEFSTNTNENISVIVQTTTDIEMARKIRKKKLSDNTLAQYNNKKDHFIDWIQEKYPNCFSDDGEINLAPESITTEILETFFGYICQKRNLKTGELVIRDSKTNEIEMQSFQHVSGYKSAIKDLYKSKKVRMSQESEDTLSEFFAGYDRTIAELKQEGKKSLVEGKQCLSFSGIIYFMVYNLLK
jgi:hypothetical protein